MKTLNCFLFIIAVFSVLSLIAWFICWVGSFDKFKEYIDTTGLVISCIMFLLMLFWREDNGKPGITIIGYILYIGFVWIPFLQYIIFLVISIVMGESLEKTNSLKKSFPKLWWFCYLDTFFSKIGDFLNKPVGI